MEEKLHIEKLNGTNYNIWKFKVKLFMIHKDCWSAVDSTTALPQTDQKALAIIGLSVKDDQIVHIQSCKSAKEAWDALKMVYEDAGTATKVMLQDELMSSKLERDGSVKDHIGKLRSIVSKLSTIDVAISDDQYIIILLRSLPPEYDQLVVTLENLDKLKVEDVHARLIREEVRRNSTNNASEPTALQSHTPWKSVKQSWKCFYCGKPGHKIAQCRKKKFDARTHNRRSESSTSSSNHSFAMIASNHSTVNEWFIDSGASFHIVGNESLLDTSSIKTIIPINITLGNGTRVQACKTGLVRMKLENNQEIILEDVLVCSEMKSNLLSVLRVQEKGYKVLFENNKCSVYMGDHLVFSCNRGENSFKLSCKVTSNRSPVVAMSSKTNETIQLWHERMGHFNENKLQETALKEYVEGIPKSISSEKVDNACRGCIAGKLTNTRFAVHKSRLSSENLDRVHSDVCGPLNPLSFQKSKYFVTFIDDWSRMLFAYAIKSKDEVPEKLNHFINQLKTQKGKCMKKLRTDNGGEYINKSVQSTTDNLGILHEKAPPYTPQMNGIAERFNRTIVEMIRSMLHHSNSPLQLWAETLQTAVYLINLQPKSVLEWKCPLEVWSGQKPDVTHLRVFGCPVDAYVSVKLRRKLESKVRRLVFVGYTLSPRIYRLIDPATRRIYDSARVIFHERDQVDWRVPKGSTVISTDGIDLSFDANHDNTPQDQDQEIPSPQSPNVGQDTDTEQPGSETNENVLRRSSRTRTVPSRLTYEYMLTDDEEADAAAMIAHVDEPASVDQAMTSSNSAEWKSAMKSEYDSLMTNNTWTLSSLPPGRKTIKCRWIFKIKTDTEGKVRYKARLVAKGYSQEYGIDYNGTFAPVIRLSTVRLLLSMAVSNLMYIHHMDCTSAFLNGDISEELYMEQPECFNDGSNRVCRLRKSLYGLKQAPRQWFLKISGVLNEIGFKMSPSDNGIYRATKQSCVVYLGLYVDDILIATTNLETIQYIKDVLCSNFKMSDLGPVKKFLNIEIDYKHHYKFIVLSQTQAINRLLEKFNMMECSTVTTPVANVKELYKDIGDKLEDNKMYRKLIGSLMFIMLGTRADIAFSVTLLSRFLDCPRIHHWKAAKRILRYLKGTVTLRLVYRSTNRTTLSVFTDADWANSQDRKSVSGISIFHDGNLIQWRSKKQNCITLSSTEAELVAVNEGLKEGIWIQSILRDMNLLYNLNLFSDNQSCINISHHQGVQSRTKHIDVRYLFIQEKLLTSNTTLQYICTDHNPADIMTKPLCHATHCDQLDLLHLC